MIPPRPRIPNGQQPQDPSNRSWPLGLVCCCWTLGNPSFGPSFSPVLYFLYLASSISLSATFIVAAVMDKCWEKQMCRRWIFFMYSHIDWISFFPAPLKWVFSKLWKIFNIIIPIGVYMTIWFVIGNSFTVCSIVQTRVIYLNVAMAFPMIIGHFVCTHAPSGLVDDYWNKVR